MIRGSLPRPTLLVCALAIGAAACGGSGGQYRASWSLQRGDAAVTCAEVAATRVELVATVPGSDETHSTSFACTAGEGTTDSFPLAQYTVVVRLLGADGAVLQSSNPISNHPLVVDDQVVDLPTIVFSFPTS